MAVVAVTGAAGFIGRATCQALIDAGSDVCALVRNHPGEQLFASRVRTVVTGDLARAEDLERSLSGCATVIHLAARVPLRRQRSEDAETGFFKANVTVAEKVFRAAARGGVKRFVYVSSAKAVGEESFTGPMNESSPPLPSAPYGRSKLLGEETVKRLGAETGLDVVVIRPPVVYGPGIRGHFQALIKLARIAHRIPLPLGGISNRRSVLFVHNLANALVLLSRHPAAAGETFFISDGRARSTPELIRAIGAALGAPTKLFPVSASFLMQVGRLVGAGAEIRKLCASLEVDDSRMRSLTGWSPPFSFEEAIALTVARRLPLVSSPPRA
jgi:nucleoside-diphosphate-sugar epimerase